MPKRKEWFGVPSVIGAVPNVEPLVVDNLRRVAREVEIRWRVLEAHREGLCELARRIDDPEEHISYAGTSRLPTQVPLQHGGHAIHHGIATGEPLLRTTATRL